MKRFPIRFLFFMTVVLFLLFLLLPDVVQRSAHESLLFCIAVLIPSLFPGFVLSSILIELFGSISLKSRLFSKVFSLAENFFQCWLLGLLSGFPSAAECACRMVQAGAGDTHDAERCLGFTNNPGIVFVICAVGGGLFGNFFVGLYLWLIQAVASIFVGMILAKPKRIMGPSASSSAMAPISCKNLLPKAVASSVFSVLNICGFVIFFRVLLSVITAGISPDLPRIFLAGLLEMTCGISMLPQFSFVVALLASAMLGWSGMSVHFQVLNVVSAQGLSVRYYFFGKFLQVLFSVLLTFLSFPALFSGGPRISLPVSVFWFFLLLFVVFSIRVRKEFVYGSRNI